MKIFSNLHYKFNIICLFKYALVNLTENPKGVFTSVFPMAGAGNLLSVPVQFATIFFPSACVTSRRHESFTDNSKLNPTETSLKKGTYRSSGRQGCFG